MQKKIGILTLPFEPNYGWILQLYALKTIIENCGYSVYVINRKWDVVKKHGFIYKIKKWLYYNILCCKICRFEKKHFIKTMEISSQENMSLIGQYNFNAIVVGSDQVWRIEHTRCVKYNFFLDFINSFATKKIAYAASFGTDTWGGNSEETIHIKKLLRDFDFISVRENSGVDLCKQIFNLDVVNLVDPSLLLEMADYDNLIESTTKPIKSILTTYILDFTNDKKKLIHILEKEFCLSINYLYPKRKNKITIYKSIENWIFNIKNAEFVLTDSFHGMVFSIIYKKQFIVYANKSRGLTRFTSLLEQLGLMDRLIYHSQDLDIKNVKKKIDYEDVDKKLAILKDKAMSYLLKYL
jgi:hypothetical protein